MHNLLTCPKCNHEFEPAVGFKKAVEHDIDLAVQAKLEELEAYKTKELEQRFMADIKERERVAEVAVQAKEAEAAELKGRLEVQAKAVQEANDLQAKYIKEQRELDDRKQEMELTIQQRVSSELDNIREREAAIVETKHQTAIAGYQSKIKQLEETAETLRKQAIQGSQQNQGEALEIVLEDTLRQAFLCDEIEPILTGGPKRGADVVQRVNAKLGREAGSIVWESKNTQNWGNDWCAKAKEDMIRERGDIAVISSVALPKSITKFGEVDGVWVCSPQYAVPLALALRSQLIELARLRNLQTNRNSAAEDVYDYLISAEFRGLVEHLVSTFDSMRDDIEREKRTALKNFAKREKQISKIIDPMTEMYAQLQGVSGETIAQVKGLEFDDEDADS